MMIASIFIWVLVQTVTPFGIIPAPPVPVPAPPPITQDLALYIGSLLYGPDVRMQVTTTQTTVAYCLGRQQYQPATLKTLFGVIPNPLAGTSNGILWTSCANDWNTVIEQLLKLLKPVVKP